jgi:hypothetical protein
MTRIDTLAIGAWKALRGKIFVTKLDEPDVPEDVVGVLGEDFLQNVDFEMDLKGGKVVLYHAEGCSDKSPPLAPTATRSSR